MGKTNVKTKVKLEEVMARKNNGKKPLVDRMILSEAEKVQVSILLERVQLLEAQSNQVKQALSALIETTVKSRGLDTKKFGVNLAAGRILPLDVPPEKG